MNKFEAAMNHRNIAINWDKAEKWCSMYWDTFGKKERFGCGLLTRFGFVLAKLRLL